MLKNQSETKKPKSIYLPKEVVVDRYEIISLLGRGTSGTVYKAKDLKVGTTVALKLINSSVRGEGSAAQRLHQEIRSAYNIKSDYVISLYSCFTDKNHVGLVLEHINGTSLFDLNEAENIFTIQEITNIGRQIALGLEAIHKAGIVHRDLKLENILLDEHGFAKITDFGVAILESTLLEDSADETVIIEADEHARRRATEEGKVVGTVHYLSPEYLKTQTCDARTDVYALGIVLYELVTSEFPYDYSSLKELVRKKINQDPTPPKKLRPDCPKWLNRLILKSMARKPEDRYQNARELYEEFVQALHQHPLNEDAVNTKRPGSEENESVNSKKSSNELLLWRSLLVVIAIVSTSLLITNFEFVEMIYYQISHFSF